MRLRCVHSCMALTVFGLVLFYSTFLNSPSPFASLLDEDARRRGNDSGQLSGQTLLVVTQTRQSGPSIIYTMKAMLEEQHQGPAAGAGAPDTPGDPAPDMTVPAGIGGAVEEKRAEETAPSAQLQKEVSVKPDTLSVPLKSIKPPSSGGAVSETAPAPAQAPVPVPTVIPVPSSSNGAPTVRDLYEPGFSFPNPGLCPEEGAHTRLFIMITSAPSHFSARDAIRLTWGHYGQRSDVGLAFLIGRSENETLLDLIETEKQLYSDLIVANFEDSYDNLTLKTMSTLEWMDTHCNRSEYLLKTDDDMFINVPNLLRFIDRIENDDTKERKIYGRLAKKWKPVRNKKSKYYISFAQHRAKVYPDFTTGPAYLLSTRLVRSLHDKGLERTYLKLEDVYTTGIIAQELKIKRMNIADFANKKVNFHKTGFCALSRLISMHMVAFHEQFELWRKILDGRTKCKVVYKQTGSAAAAPAAGPAAPKT